MESSHPTENRSRRRHWEWLLLLLALLMSFACVFLSSWISLSTWPDRLVKASMLAGEGANYKHSDQEDVAFGSLNPEVAAEAATDAARLQLTPSNAGRGTPAGIALLPPTPRRSATPTPALAAVTIAPSPTAASPNPTHGPTLPPSPTPAKVPPTATTQPTRTQVPVPTATAPIPTPSSTLSPPTDTPTAAPPLPTDTPTAVPPPPTNTPKATHTPRPHPPTHTPVPPSDTPTPSPTASSTSTPSPTPSPTSTDTPVAPIVLDIRPQAALLGSSMPVTVTGNNFESGLQAALDGTPLLNVIWTSATMLTAEVPSTMPTGTYTLTVTNPGPTSGSRANAFQVFTYTVPAPVDCSTPNPDVINCNDASGAPDDQWAGIFTPTGVITLDFGSLPIRDGLGYDLVFYERSNPDQTPPGIALDYITIEISSDGVTWLTLFSWDGDSSDGSVVETNIDSYAASSNELYNEPIPGYDLYPGIPGGPNTGIAMDVRRFGAGPFQYVRVTRPPGGQNEPAEVDAIVRLN